MGWSCLHNSRQRLTIRFRGLPTSYGPEGSPERLEASMDMSNHGH